MEIELDIIEVRKKRDMSQVEVGEFMGVDGATICRLEKLKWSEMRPMYRREYIRLSESRPVLEVTT